MPKYPIEVYRREFPEVEFKQSENGDIRYKDNQGDFRFRVEDGTESSGGYYPRIAPEIGEKFRAMHNGSYVPKPLSVKSSSNPFMLIVNAAEKEAALRKQLEEIEEAIEAIEEDGDNAPSLYVAQTFGYHGLPKEEFAFVSTSEEEVELWYNLRGQVRSTLAYGHGFVPEYMGEDEPYGNFTGRVYKLDYEDNKYAEALTAYINRLKQ